MNQEELNQLHTLLLKAKAFLQTEAHITGIDYISTGVEDELIYLHGFSPYDSNGENWYLILGKEVDYYRD